MRCVKNGRRIFTDIPVVKSPESKKDDLGNYISLGPVVRALQLKCMGRF